MKDKKVLLMGNPNVGKSTVFNEITGSHQHTGNWTGKTVGVATGRFYYKFNNYKLVDLPGTYSLLSSSEEERVARDYLCFEDYDCVVSVVDATNLERNLNLVLQVTEVTDKVVVLLNLWDEAKKKNITVDTQKLSKILGVPVVKATARSGKGINELLEQVHLISNGLTENQPHQVFYQNQIENAVHSLSKRLSAKIGKDSKLRFFALRLLEGNSVFDKSFKNAYPDLGSSLWSSVKVNRIELEKFGVDITKSVVNTLSSKAADIASSTVVKLPSKAEKREQLLDKILLGKYTSVPVMLLMFAVVLWLTVAGSNYPSAVLRSAFDSFELWLSQWLTAVNAPDIFISLFVNGILKVLLWVVAVMLPPMTIFFPLFAIMEDSGILPRIAFNLDGAFEKCGACGKQALTTCMGYGCNAVGVSAARIIDSPRERLIAVVTNSLAPCNGRFPLLIAVIAMFFSNDSFLSAVILLGFMSLSMAMTFLNSKILTKTVLKGVSSTFVLELPPYRKPKFLSLIWDTVREKIIFVLFRAVAVSAPAGLVIWIIANINVGDTTLLVKISQILDPIGQFIGLDGIMLLAFILGFPANEIVIPIALMAYLSTGELSDYSSLESLKSILTDNGWTWVTALCTCIFSMFHFPCSTTLLTIWRETKSVKWTLLSVAVPLITGFVLCAVINAVF